MTKLRPCPHCGEVEHLYPAHRDFGGGPPYAIDCIGCGHDFVPRDGFDVVALWNRRDREDALVEALRGAIGALEFSRDYHKDLGNEEQAFAQDRLDAATRALEEAK